MPKPRESCVWVLKTGRVIVKENTSRFPNAHVLLAILVYLSFERTGDLAIREGLRQRNLKKETIKVYVSRSGRAVLWVTG